MTDNLIVCEHLGLVIPTIVYYKGERLETVGLDIETLTKIWRDKWVDLQGEWIVLALPERDYGAIQQKTLSCTRSVREILYEHKVICIRQRPIGERAIEEMFCGCCTRLDCWRDLRHGRSNRRVE